eukprot:scaffold4066_cov417-Prasinococcus_capsulatus_cf.AAC.13
MAAWSSPSLTCPGCWSGVENDPYLSVPNRCSGTRVDGGASRSHLSPGSGWLESRTGPFPLRQRNLPPVAPPPRVRPPFDRAPAWRKVGAIRCLRAWRVRSALLLWTTVVVPAQRREAFLPDTSSRTRMLAAFSAPVAGEPPHVSALQLSHDEFCQGECSPAWLSIPYGPKRYAPRPRGGVLAILCWPG